ncbi:MAG: nucleotidyltransferase domain-containing protein [Thermoleophilia bacterium]|nr:nucleotidyltransferase domain-containing protein [Thermoleophilia bacterium]
MPDSPTGDAEEAVEGFALRTKDGLIFTVKGTVHPPDAIVAYLRYIPDRGGDREHEGARYRRVYGFEEQEDALRARWPTYLRSDPMFGVRLQAVPTEDIRCVYDPRRRLQDLSDRGPADQLEEAALGLTELLRDTARVPLQALGVSGSVLLGLHRPESDIDIVVYGEEESRAVHGALFDLLDQPSAPVRRPQGDELAAIHEMHRSDTPLSPIDFARLQARKVNEGRFRGRPYFIRFVKRRDQVAERYGDPRYESLEPALIRARVEDQGEALFTPCCYPVVEVSFLEGTPTEDLRQIVSFRGRFADQAKRGDWVLARGRLERVHSLRLPGFSRLAVGGQPGDYLLS